MTAPLLAALVFAVVVGLNDGAALLGSNLAGKAVRPLSGTLVMTVALLVVPGVIGTKVAETLAEGLVGFDDAEGERALLVALVVTIGLVLAAARLGLPTSVTHALTGAMVGAALGTGLAIDVGGVVRVMMALALVPLVAGVAAVGVTVVIVRTRLRSHIGDHLRRLHAAGYVVASVAYAANDGQKLHAVAAIALGTVPSELGFPVSAALAILFAAGSVMGVSRLAARFRRLLPARPLNTVVAGYAAGLSVLASATAGAPVSMSHATSAGLVGSAAAIGSYRHVRWERTVPIVAAWVTTLPAALVIATVLSALAR